MDKVTRKNKQGQTEVAVVYSPGWGVGWSSLYGDSPELLFSPAIVNKIIEGKSITATDIAAAFGKTLEQFIESEHDARDIALDIFGLPAQLSVAWIPEGAQFMIDEYDGAESVVLLSNLKIHTA